MRYRDDVLAGVLLIDAFDGTAGAVIEVHEAFAAWRRLVDRCEPVAADLDRPAGKERGAIETLPFAEILFGKGGILRHAGRLGKSRGADSFRRLMRPLQIAGEPDRIARQDLCDRLEHFAVTGVAADVFLPVDAAAVLAHRRVPHPPPSCRDHALRQRVVMNERFVWIGHLKNPSLLFRRSLYVRVDVTSSNAAQFR